MYTLIESSSMTRLRHIAHMTSLRSSLRNCRIELNITDAVFIIRAYFKYIV